MNDDQLWAIAKKRASFKRHFSIYVLINIFLWGVWWFSDGSDGTSSGPVPWPAWVSLGWGLGIGFSYFEAYGDGDLKTTTQKEFEKLKREKEAQQNP
jgi:2TM domain